MKLTIHHYPQVDSTNNVAKAYLELGACEGTVILADQQTGGRGQFQRMWQSPKGNFYGSMILKPSQEWQSSYHQLGYVAAVALKRALAHVLPLVPIHLKYPNDIFLEGKKMAGILIEVEEGAVILGMGVNVQVAPEGLDQPTTCLQHHIRRPVTVSEVTPFLLKDLWHTYKGWLNHEFENLYQEWLSNSLPQ